MNKHRRKRAIIWAVVFLLGLFTLSGCGGGGSSGGAGSGSPTNQNQDSNWDTMVWDQGQWR